MAAATLVDEVQADQAILDGELAVTDAAGRSLFSAMMYDRSRAMYARLGLP